MRSQRRRQRQQSDSGAGFSGRAGRDRVHFWRIASASAKEVDSHLRLLERAGVVNTGKAERVLETFDQVRAMTWRLINPGT